MAFFLLNNLRVNNILISDNILETAQRADLFTLFGETRNFSTGESRGRSQPLFMEFGILVSPRGYSQIPGAVSLLVFPAAGPGLRLGSGSGSGCGCGRAGCPQLCLPVRTARSIPWAALATEQECFTIVLLGTDKSSQAFYGQVLQVALGVLVIRRQSSGCWTQPYYLWQGTVAEIPPQWQEPHLEWRFPEPETGDTEAFSFLMSQSRVNPIVSKNDMQSPRGRRHFCI